MVPVPTSYVNNVNSAWVRPRGKARMQVTFRKAGKYTVETNLGPSEIDGSGLLVVT
jgi:hypothetical protein